MSEANVAIIGQLPPAITGEASANTVVISALTSHNVTCVTRDSSISQSANDVGRFSLAKLISSIYVALDCIRTIKDCQFVYITPGQTLMGLFRFYPIVMYSILRKKQLVVHWHGYGALRGLSRFVFLRQAYLNSCVLNIVLTEDLRIRMTGISPTSRIEVIRNFTSIPPLPDFNQKPSNRTLRVTYLGSLMPEKGILFFLEVAARSPEIDFVVCGGGSPEYQDLVSRAHQRGDINYKGTVHGEEKTKILFETDVFVLQTHYATEGVPLSILEAMAMGCAIVTTVHNGIPETVADAAVYCKPGDPEDLLRKLEWLDNNRIELAKLQAAAILRARAHSKAQFQAGVVAALNIGQRDSQSPRHEQLA